MSPATVSAPPLVQMLGRCDYAETYAAMRAYAQQRGEASRDLIWLVEHPPVFTQGIAGRAEHVLAPGGIPVHQTDRGGQVTYHGPGQVVAYPLVDLRRQGIYVREFVYRVEQAVLDVLQVLGVTGHRVSGAPGIYVRLDAPFSHAALWGPPDPADPFRGLGKIAALGVKVARHGTYHGVALNAAMDLAPFQRINPCGYAGLRTVDLATLGVSTECTEWPVVAELLGQRLQALLSR